MSKINIIIKVRMKSILFIALTLIAILSADLSGGSLYSEEEQNTSSLLAETGGNMENENVLSDEDTVFFPLSYTPIPSLCRFSGPQVSKTALTFANSVFQPPKEAAM